MPEEGMFQFKIYSNWNLLNQNIFTSVVLALTNASTTTTSTQRMTGYRWPHWKRDPETSPTPLPRQRTQLPQPHLPRAHLYQHDYHSKVHGPTAHYYYNQPRSIFEYNNQERRTRDIRNQPNNTYEDHQQGVIYDNNNHARNRDYRTQSRDQDNVPNQPRTTYDNAAQRATQQYSQYDWTPQAYGMFYNIYL